MGALCCFVAASTFLHAAVIYVDPAAAGANNGTSWANAFTSLATALQNANSGDEIWVKAGVYKPTTQVDVNASGGADVREASFHVPDGVALYGGFAGTELSREERNWLLNKTVLSGDLDNNDLNGDGNFIAENTDEAVGNNAYHVLYSENAGAATRLDGFIVTAGRAASADVITDPNQDGGAWYVRLSGLTNASSPTMVNTVFQGNYAASEGGALYFTNAAAGGAVLSLIQDCKFHYNKSNSAGGAINLGSFNAGNYQPHILGCEFFMNEAFRRGGAIYLVGDHAKIEMTVFRSNKVTAVSMGETLPGSGGGVGMTSSNASFTRCLFDANTTTGNPTGFFEGGGGGAVYMSTNEIQTTTLGPSEPKFIGCGFYSNIASGNTAAWGGAAVHLSDGGKLRPQYVNCVFYGNQAQNHGGAVANFTRVLGVEDGFVPELAPGFTNCTFTANQAGGSGGALYNFGFVYNAAQVLQARIENSILWNNTATTSGPEVYNTGNNMVSYSLIKGSGGSGGGWNGDIGTDEDPEFVNEASPLGADGLPATGDDGLRLVSSAPPVDAGNSSAAGLSGITTDYRGAERIQGARVDMGAYEQAKINVPTVKIYWLKNWKDFKPSCLSCPWAFLIPEIQFKQFIWDGQAQLVIDGDVATISGHIINPFNKTAGFDVHLKLVKMQDWETWSGHGGSYLAYTPEAAQTAQTEHTNWVFWELSGESYLKGTGDIHGRLKLSQTPPRHKLGFQFGEGANGLDKDLGIGGLFSYKGKLLYKGKRLNANGRGSLNVDAAQCMENCSLEKSGAFSAVPQMLPHQGEAETDTEDFTVFPVPAYRKLTIATKVLVQGMYSLRFYTSAGQLQKQANIVLGRGNYTADVSDLKPGVYVLQILSASGDMINKKIIIE
jgi:hypothetical protein